MLYIICIICPTCIIYCMYIKSSSPTLLLLFDRKSTLRVRPATVTSGELSSQNLVRGSFYLTVLWTERLYTMKSSYYNRWELKTCENKTHDLLLLLSDLQEVAAPVAVGVLRSQGERRARKVQLALGFLCFLRYSIRLIMRGDRKVWYNLDGIWGWSMMEYGRNILDILPWTWRHTWRSCRRSRHPGWRSRQTRQLREWSSSWTCQEDKCNLGIINYMKLSSCIYMES